MPISRHHTKKIDKTHLEDSLDQLWDTEVVPSLPDDLEEKAREYQALVRKRGFPNATILLRVLLAYVILGHSFRSLGIWATLMNLVCLSDTALRKALQRSNAWLLWLIGRLSALPQTDDPLPWQVEGRVLLIDATRLAIPGGTGDDWRVHIAYDLLTGRMVEVRVTDKHTAEVLVHFDLQRGDIVVVDGGYGYRRSVAYAVARAADVVMRIHPFTFPLVDEEGQPFDVLKVLRKRKSASLQDIPLYCWYEGKRYPVRLVMQRLSPQEARAARKHKIMQAKKRGKKVTQEQLIIAGWVLLVTTLPSDQWSAQDVLRMYRARWQVELVIKRMKQVLEITNIHCTTPESVEPSVRAFLVAWLLQEQEAVWVRHVLEHGQAIARGEAEPSDAEWERITSSWLVTKICVETVRNQVRGQWTKQRLHACLPYLQRYFCSKKRRDRSHQETEMRHWLLERLRKSHEAYQKAA